VGKFLGKKITLERAKSMEVVNTDRDEMKI
jgi:hypothetical protein